MAIEIKKREGESVSSMLYRFKKRVKQSGILKEAKKRRFYGRSENRVARRRSALYRTARRTEIARARKYGHEPRERRSW